MVADEQIPADAQLLLVAGMDIEPGSLRVLHCILFCSFTSFFLCQGLSGNCLYFPSMLRALVYPRRLAFGGAFQGKRTEAQDVLPFF